MAIDLKASSKLIATNIANVAKSGEAFNVLVHETIIAILEHDLAFNDCSKALALVMAMPKSVRREMVINSFRDYSPIGINVKTGKCGHVSAKAKQTQVIDVEGYRANPWYARVEGNVELPDTTLEAANNAVIGLAKRLQGKLDEGKVAANDVAAVTALVGKVQGIALKLAA